MGDLTAHFLPPRPPSSFTEVGHRFSNPSRPVFQGLDLLGVMKRGQGVRSWIRVDTEGNTNILEADKAAIMRRCDLPARDLRLLDPLFVYPSTILGRERAIVVNLEQIRCIITADEVLVLNSLEPFVFQYVSELQRKLTSKISLEGQGFKWRSPGGQPIGAHSYGGHHNVEAAGNKEVRQRRVHDTDMFSGSSADDLPFEFKALEVALEAACIYLDTQAAELEEEAYPVLDELTSKISTLNLERVRRLKSRLLAMTRRVQKVRDELEQLMDDDGDMAEMYLTEKKEHMEHPIAKDQALLGFKSMGHGSISAPVSPVCSPTGSRVLEKTLSIGRSRHGSPSRSESGDERVEELEMLLEAYFVVIDGILNKLTALKEYIEDTEDFINIQLVRDELEQLMDDDGDMAEMYLTEKKEHMEHPIAKDQALLGFKSMGHGGSISAPVSPVCSPTGSRVLEKTLSIGRSRHGSPSRSESGDERVEELEMLLEAYFVVIDGILNKLTAVSFILSLNIRFI
ncbi:hypothetical protein O6H91_09G047800 [Diphasiastrum complanatum]|uniref:Uncharacterized protein n=1 Tax=Diphasiastrum complanatum TaxID=34168 RepID=A0ACC2CNU4_DIPCM|nr:hypothetical protein O6H91_09G047800 [Diphasiastrum complanatum]